MQSFAQQVITLLGSSGGNTSGVSSSWAAVERSVGLELPRDYKELSDNVGSVLVDEWLCLFGADTENPNASILNLIEERESAWVNLRDSGVELREDFFAEGARLIAFASIEATYFYWHAVAGVDVDDWAVVVVDDDLDEWYTLEMSATECIYKVLVGDIRLNPFDDLFGRAEHVVEPIASSSTIE